MFNNLYSLALKVLSLFVVVIVSFILMRVMGKDEFGFYSLIISSVLLLSTIANFGINFYVVDFIPKMESKIHSHIVFSIYVKIILPSLLMGGLLFFYLKKQYDMESAWVSIIIIFVFNVNYINVAILRAMKKFNTSLFLESIVFYSLSCFFIYALGFSFDKNGVMYSILMASIISSFISTLFLFLCCERKEIYDKKMVFSLKSARPFFYLSIAEVITLHLDVALISYFYTLEDVGEYFFAKKFLVFFTLFWFLYNYKNTPVISGLISDPLKNSLQISRIIKERINVFIVSLIFGAALIFCYPYVSNVFEISNGNQIFSLQILFFIFSLIHIATGPVVSFLNVSGCSHLTYKVVLFGSFMFFISFLPFMHFYGTKGIVLSLIFSMLGWKLVGIYVIKNKTGFNLLTGEYS